MWRFVFKECEEPPEEFEILDGWVYEREEFVSTRQTQMGFGDDGEEIRTQEGYRFIQNATPVDEYIANQQTEAAAEKERLEGELKTAKAELVQSQSALKTAQAGLEASQSELQATKERLNEALEANRQVEPGSGVEGPSI